MCYCIDWRRYTQRITEFDTDRLFSEAKPRDLNTRFFLFNGFRIRWGTNSCIGEQPTHLRSHTSAEVSDADRKLKMKLTISALLISSTAMSFLIRSCSEDSFSNKTCNCALNTTNTTSQASTIANGAQSQPSLCCSLPCHLQASESCSYRSWKPSHEAVVSRSSIASKSHF
jgi:hypothetical protein